MAELRLAGMVLAYGPKSEESWAYRCGSLLKWFLVLSLFMLFFTIRALFWFFASVSSFERFPRFCSHEFEGSFLERGSSIFFVKLFLPKFAAFISFLTL